MSQPPTEPSSPANKPPRKPHRKGPTRPPSGPRTRSTKANAAITKLAQEPACERCGKPAVVCVCDRVEALLARTRVVILQHPQEDDVILGTARLVTLALDKATIRRGLSWASIEQAVDDNSIDRDRWAVLAVAKLPEGTKLPNQPVVLLDRHGSVLDISNTRVEGIVVLDGTWSQAKTLWWRNPWLLKLRRIHLTPREPSLYGQLRNEPRREAVSTLEAIADVLPSLGAPEATRDGLRRLLRTMLQRARDAAAAQQPKRQRRARTQPGATPQVDVPEPTPEG